MEKERLNMKKKQTREWLVMMDGAIARGSKWNKLQMVVRGDLDRGGRQVCTV